MEPYTVFVGDNTVQSLTLPVLFFEDAQDPHNDLKLCALYCCKSLVHCKQEFIITYFFVSLNLKETLLILTTSGKTQQ